MGPSPGLLWALDSLTLCPTQGPICLWLTDPGKERPLCSVLFSLPPPVY